MAHAAKLLLLLALLGHTSCDVSTEHDVSTRAATAASLTTLAGHLAADIKSLTAQLATLQAENAKKQSVITSLSGRLHNQTVLSQGLTREQFHTDHTIDVLDATCRRALGSLNNRTAALEHGVAMAARFSNDSVGNLAVHNGLDRHGNPSHDFRLLFDYVQYQTSSPLTYNKTTGFFTAPTDGTYLFFLTVTNKEPQTDDCVEVWVRTPRIREAVAFTSSCPGGYTVSSNMVVAPVHKGDKTSVLTRDADRIFGYVHTSFTAIRLSTKFEL